MRDTKRRSAWQVATRRRERPAVQRCHPVGNVATLCSHADRKQLFSPTRQLERGIVPLTFRTRLEHLLRSTHSKRLLPAPAEGRGFSVRLRCLRKTTIGAGCSVASPSSVRSLSRSFKLQSDAASSAPLARICRGSEQDKLRPGVIPINILTQFTTDR